MIKLVVVAVNRSIPVKLQLKNKESKWQSDAVVCPNLLEEREFVMMMMMMM